MSKYKLSVVIPARNEEWLSRTIEDVLVNSGPETEIIVGLDGKWAEPPIKDNPRVTIVHVSESIGQRAMTNQLVRLSDTKFILKLDAHCAMDKDFDKKMFEAFEIAGDNVVIAPTMRNLHVFNWKCPDGHIRYQGQSGPCKEMVNGKECGKETFKDVVWIPKTNPSSTSYCFDPEPHFQYANEMKNRQWYKDQGDLTESMSLQGSCFMVTREKYWELNLGDEEFGSWGSQGIQIALSFWLSGGRVLVNHKTWYAHLFRTAGGDFGFPYEISGKQTEHAKKLAKEKMTNSSWPKQIHPVSWLVEKFWPISKWTNEDLIKIGGRVPPKEKLLYTPTKGVIYYTDNQLDPKIMAACQKQLLKATKGMPIVSCSLKPTELGKNIVLNLERGYITMTKQILTALEELDTDIVYFCEHDDLYDQSYFDFTPKDKETWYYNGNYWFLRLIDGFAVHYNVSPLSGLVVYRESAIKHYRERLAFMESQGDKLEMLRLGFEPFTHGRIDWKYKCKSEIFQSAIPTVDIAHGANVTKKRWSQDKFRRKPTFWEESIDFQIPNWDKLKVLLA